MEVTFGSGETSAAAVAPAPTPTAPAPEQSAAAPAPAAPPAGVAGAVPAVVSSPGVPAGPSGLVLGDKIPEFKDIILPRLNISQNIGQLQETFPSGTLVYNQQVALFTPPEIDPKSKAVINPATAPVIMVVLGFRPTRYSEKIAGGAKGLLVNTEAEVRAAGGTLDYTEWNLKKKDGMKLFQPFADALVAIERPESLADDDTVFIYPVDDKKYALALWGMKGTAYTAAAKRVFFTARAVGCLRKGYPTWSYALTTREDTFPGNNKAWVPVCVPKAPTSPAFMDFVRGVLGSPA